MWKFFLHLTMPNSTSWMFMYFFPYYLGMVEQRVALSVNGSKLSSLLLSSGYCLCGFSRSLSFLTGFFSGFSGSLSPLNNLLVILYCINKCTNVCEWCRLIDSHLLPSVPMIESGSSTFWISVFLTSIKSLLKMTEWKTYPFNHSLSVVSVNHHLWVFPYVNGWQEF